MEISKQNDNFSPALGQSLLVHALVVVMLTVLAGRHMHSLPPSPMAVPVVLHQALGRQLPVPPTSHTPPSQGRPLPGSPFPLPQARTPNSHSLKNGQPAAANSLDSAGVAVYVQPGLVAQPVPSEAQACGGGDNANGATAVTIMWEQGAGLLEIPHTSVVDGESGTATLCARVDDTGGITELHIAHSSGFSRLDRAILSGVSRWRLRSARHGDLAWAKNNWIDFPVTVPNLSR